MTTLSAAHDQNLRQRLDKWLWHARLVKTRTTASKLIAAGRIRVNRDKIAKPSQTVKVGDVITVVINGRVRIIKVLDISDRRLSAESVKLVLEDLSPPLSPDANDL